MIHHSIRRFQDARVGLGINVVRPEKVGGRLASTKDVSFILGLRASATCQRLVKSLISWFREVVLKRIECSSAIGRAREMPRSISRSPQRKGRRRSLERSPSPVSHRHVSRRSRREHRSRSPPHAHTHGRRKSWSLSPRRGKKRVSRSPLVHKSRSPSLLSSEERKWAIGRACEQEEKKRRRYEAELKLVEDETSKRVEETIRRKVQEALESDDFKLVVEVQIEEGRKRIIEDISFQLEREKEDLLSEARRKEERIRQEKEELEKMLEDNRRKIEESQKRAAEEQARKEEERYKELEALQQQKEEHVRRKKLQDEQNRTEQMKILGKKNTRPKLSFALGSK